ncbi:class I SAM-dependent methyltransferase [Aquipuribacter nitratireducens]|uniref:SAM-dependent methyltransferase n=1 Tax=Aquipuribacter nitratireducens TaxID=650104 RepID=A0ABW0GKS7_9MICO
MGEGAAGAGDGAPTGLSALLRPEGWALLEALPPYDPDRALALGERLRADGVPPGTVAAALTQSRLRAAARDKVGAFADGMLFTPDGLEQATRLPVAARHAARLRAAGATRVADLGCGIGVDALAMAGMDLAVDAVERDEATAAVATVNLRHFPRARVHLGDATGFPAALPVAQPGTPGGVDAAWADPARRAGGRRLTDPEAWSPPLSWALGLPGTGVRAVGVKVAPGVDHALVAPGGPAHGWTAAWTSVDGDVVEAVLWWGAAAVTGAARSATVLRSVTRDGAVEVQEAGTLTDVGLPVPPVGGVGAYLHEPDGAVVRAGLVGHVAAAVGGRLLDPMIAYVTADDLVPSPLARSYEVRAVLPWGLKRLRAYLRGHGVGRVTVKRRGSPIDPDELRRALRLDGDGEATVVLTRRGDERLVLVVDPVTA